MARVRVPALMRDLTAGLAVVSAPGRTVAEVLEALDGAYPGFRARLAMGEGLRPGLMVVVDGRAALLALRQRVDEESEIAFLPAVAGG